MNKEELFKGIYDDFFGVEKEEVLVKSKEDVDMQEIFNKIEYLMIDDESKDLLKKIIEYMRKYKEKIETNYIPFRISIISKDRKTILDLLDIIKKSSQEYEYVNEKVSEYSLLHIEKNVEIDPNSGIIILKELTGLSYLDEKDKKRLSKDIENSLYDNHNIELVVGTKDEVDNFFLENHNLRDKFDFTINYKNPDVQDIYQNVINRVEIAEDKRPELLDYISNTIKEVEDYNVYEDNIIKEITFNKRVPKLEGLKSLDEIFEELNELVGLQSVKKVLHELVDLIELKKKSNGELKINDVNLHMVFLGNPGTGKTTVARLVANILYNLKYIRKNTLVEVSSKDLVAEYVGQTAPKTNAVIEKAMGGVLFIDEAYSLAVKGENSYNAEAIATLIQAMENHRDDLVVIFAGYTKEMQDFLNSNSGIVSRIGYTLDFPDYTEDELSQIFVNMMTKSGFVINNDALDYLKEIIRENKNKENFGNARFIRNVYEKTIIKHASNTKNKVRKKILKTITKNDISVENIT